MESEDCTHIDYREGLVLIFLHDRWRMEEFYRPLMLKIMHVAMNLINTHIFSFYSIIVAGDRNNFMQTLKLSVSL